MLIENSRDVLNLVVAFSVLWVALFLSWLLYYAAQILRHANQIVEDVQTRMHELAESVGYLRDKLELVGAGVGFLMDGVKMMTGKLVGAEGAEKSGRVGVKLAKKKAKRAVKHLLK
ncbi:hypothetical protein HY065_02075 [Candidatus Berkelbacteria bacterium]|nr:hypothetical protein [Candidatus Berkelbacteria bacterium]